MKIISFSVFRDFLNRKQVTTTVFSPNAGKCAKNTDENNSKYGHFLRNVRVITSEKKD